MQRPQLSQYSKFSWGRTLKPPSLESIFLLKIYSRCNLGTPKIQNFLGLDLQLLLGYQFSAACKLKCLMFQMLILQQRSKFNIFFSRDTFFSDLCFVWMFSGDPRETDVVLLPLKLYYPRYVFATSTMSSTTLYKRSATILHTLKT